MKYRFRTLCLVILTTSLISCQQQKQKYLTLDGEILKSDEVNTIAEPYLQIALSGSSEGMVLYFPGDGSANDSLSTVFHRKGFSVATLKGNKLKPADAIRAYRLILSEPTLQVNTGYTCIIGSYDGAELAAMTEYGLEADEHPDDLILINPTGFDETTRGTVFPLVNPPLSTKTRLLCITDTVSLGNAALKAAVEFAKTWIGYDGIAWHEEIAYAWDLTSGNRELMDVLTEFQDGVMPFPIKNTNPAAAPVEGYSPLRHAEKVELIKSRKYDLLFIGNSITNNWEKPGYQAAWDKYFGSRNAINLGYSGYRTENIIWNIKNGELENQDPKVIIVEIGTNNIDEKNYPTRHTAGQLAGGMEEIVRILRQECPDSKIVLLRCFPGCYGGPNPTSHRRILERASDMVSRLADNEQVFYCDVNHVFLNMDGSINHELMPDWLHPNPEGAELWARAMEPLLSRLMEDEPRNDHPQSNTAIIPTSKLEKDNYNWWVRHNDILKMKDSLNPEIVLIGNSITHFWGGKYPPFKDEGGNSREPNGPESWKVTFGSHRVLNLGFGWDRTQNVLWRLDKGELDGLDPKLVVIHIGTNNTSETRNARMNTAPEIVEGIEAICLRVRSKVPRAKIVLMQIMPREEGPDHPRRILINETNEILRQFAGENDITLLDISSEMLTSEGILRRELANDFCHPTDAGYKIWGEALRPFIEGI